MSTIVLVHGALQTAATWDRIVPALRAAGHTVHTPPLTGLDPTSGPLTAHVTLDTHVADIVGFIASRDLRDVMLVGHSYAGMVVTGAAVHLGARVGHLVYMDAFVPRRGEAAVDFMPDSIRQKFQARLAPDGFRIVADDHLIDQWHLDPAGWKFARDRRWDFSMNCFTQPLREAAELIRVDRSFLACVGPYSHTQDVFASFANRAKREHWPYFELATGHECQISAPEETTEIVLALCQRTAATR